MKSYSVFWFVFTGNHPLAESSIGVCGYKMQPAFLALGERGFLHALVVSDLYVDEVRGECEERERCLNVKCSLNRTTPETWIAANRLTGRDAKLVKRRWSRLIEMVQAAQQLVSEYKDELGKEKGHTMIFGIEDG